MAAQHVLLNPDSWNLQALLEVDTLPRDLSHHGLLYLEKLALAIDEVAPKPGLLVYVAATILDQPINGLDAVLFSAIDVCTHLQVAQVYHSLTTAAAVSFVEFVAESFPLPISQIRTLAEPPFHDGSNQASKRNFSVLIGRQGFVHSPIADPSRDALLSITAKVHFKSLAGKGLVRASSHDLQREVGQFLLFHNNYRTIPWLGGKTPLQRLKFFEGFGSIHSFSPNDGQE
ncbi:MAG: hypothetical protein NTU47_14865 [Ignavibacteriales bacterium]|nr:hypothetical protein [Ignavibacteriales bacterium]